MIIAHTGIDTYACNKHLCVESNSGVLGTYNKAKSSTTKDLQKMVTLNFNREGSVLPYMVYQYSTVQ